MITIFYDKMIFNHNCSVVKCHKVLSCTEVKMIFGMLGQVEKSVWPEWEGFNLRIARCGL